MSSPIEKIKQHSRRKPHAHASGGSHGEELAHDESNWLVSYADMMTLLFGFFVLMYTFSKIDEKKFEVVRKDVARYFGGQVKMSPTSKKLEEDLKESIKSAGLDSQVELVARDSAIELRFNGSLHFAPGTADLSAESKQVLDELITTLKRQVRADTVTVEGHTDDDPVRSEKYPSNWELSSARASTVVRVFEKYGFDPTKMTTQGFGSSRPLAPNRNSRGEPIPVNQEINRRVLVTVGFTEEVEDAIHALKTDKFKNADAPEFEKTDENKNPLVLAGEGEATEAEKSELERKRIAERLRLAEQRLKETEVRNREAKELAEMEARVKQIEKRIETSVVDTQKYIENLKKKGIAPPAVTPAVTNTPIRAPAQTKGSKKKIQKKQPGSGTVKPAVTPSPTVAAPAVTNPSAAASSTPAPTAESEQRSPSSASSEKGAVPGVLKESSAENSAPNSSEIPEEVPPIVE